LVQHGKSRPVSGKVLPLSVTNPEARIEELIASPFVEDLLAAAKHSALTEDLALTILRRRDLQASVLEAIARNHSVIKQRKVLVSVAEHQYTPRHISLPLLRRLFTFELMQVALGPSVLADVKRVAEEVLVAKLGTLSLGERITLARRASPKVAGALLLHREPSVIEAALQNPRITEASIVKSLARSEIPAPLLAMLAAHSKWSVRREIQIGILRRPEASDSLALRIAAKLPKRALHEVLTQYRLPTSRRELLQRALLQR
jgi:hypothetical protein